MVKTNLICGVIGAECGFMKLHGACCYIDRVCCIDCDDIKDCCVIQEFASKHSIKITKQSSPDAMRQIVIDGGKIVKHFLSILTTIPNEQLGEMSNYYDDDVLSHVQEILLTAKPKPEIKELLFLDQHNDLIHITPELVEGLLGRICKDTRLYLTAATNKIPIRQE